MAISDWLVIGCVLFLIAVFYAGRRGWVVKAPPRGWSFCPTCGGKGKLPRDGVSAPRSYHG